MFQFIDLPYAVFAILGCSFVTLQKSLLTYYLTSAFAELISALGVMLPQVVIDVAQLVGILVSIYVLVNLFRKAECISILKHILRHSSYL